MFGLQKRVRPLQRRDTEKAKAAFLTLVDNETVGLEAAMPEMYDCVQRPGMWGRAS
jgi:hypothetical protein